MGLKLALANEDGYPAIVKPRVFVFVRTGLGMDPSHGVPSFAFENYAVSAAHDNGSFILAVFATHADDILRCVAGNEDTDQTTVILSILMPVMASALTSYIDIVSIEVAVWLSFNMPVALAVRSQMREQLSGFGL